MAIPDFQSILLPLLKFYAKHSEVKLSDSIDAMAKHFKLTEAEREEMLPSGRDYLFRNRVAWARQYLVYATLARPVRRGVVAITDLGKKWAAERKTPLKISDFNAIEGYDRRVRGEDDSRGATAVTTEVAATATPDQRIEDAERELRQATIVTLIDRVLARPPEFFERLVIQLMSRLGYGDGSEESMLHTGRTGDEGIDGRIKMDVLGIDQIFLQAKRYDTSNTVGRDAVASFAGSIAGAKGVFVTTSQFSRQAQEFVRTSHRNIVLIDGQKLGALMLRSRLGVSVKKTYEVFALDEDFFAEEE
jgi:restriction system protein